MSRQLGVVFSNVKCSCSGRDWSELMCDIVQPIKKAFAGDYGAVIRRFDFFSQLSFRAVLPFEWELGLLYCDVACPFD